MTTIQIKHRWNGEVLFECELSAEVVGQAYGLQLGFAIRKAVSAGADLSGADLTGADLTDADLTRAYLAGADLAGADLTRAYLADADLSGADLAGADLTRAYLADADLSGADLSGADFTDANLAGADLTGADLTDADLAPIKADVFMLLLHAIPEVPALLAAIKEGRIDGSAYEGPCACLVGTIANARHCGIHALPDGLRPDSSRPAERFFLAIKKGDTPETNGASKIAAEWVTEFLALVQPTAAVSP